MIEKEVIYKSGNNEIDLKIIPTIENVEKLKKFIEVLELEIKQV